jgi:threonine/homoserine/homoserine lactone efflux protein
MLMYLLQGFGYGFGAAAQPGFLQTFILSQALQNGWRRTLPAALAPLLSDGPIVVLVVLVLSQVPDWLQRFLYIGGGLFMLYLAWDTGRSWRGFNDETQATSAMNEQGFLKAALVNLLSPGPYLYWGLVTGPILVTSWRESPATGIAFLGGFYGAMVGTNLVLIVVFGATRRFGPKVTRGLLGVSAILMAGFGLYQLWRGLSGY